MKCRSRPRILMLLIGLTSAEHAWSDTAHLACYGCHGPGGISEAEHLPTIAGLNFQYFYGTMQSFRKDQRRSTIMGRIAKGYKTSQLQRMALHFGRHPWTGKIREVDPGLAERGRELHQEFCEKCHEQNGHFQDRDTPPLAGQAPGYLVHQMSDYRSGGDDMPQPALMQERLEKLSDHDLTALAAFYASPLATKPPAEVGAEPDR